MKMRNHSNLSKSITKYDDYSPKDKVQKQQNIKLQYWHRITPMVQKNPLEMVCFILNPPKNTMVMQLIR